MSKTVFITGATSGIGLATAKIFAQNKFKLILCGRREERLKQLSDELGESTKCEFLVFDVRKNEEVVEKVNSLPQDFNKIDILINNAGNAHGFD